MTKEELKYPTRYIYLDHDGIDSLYAQTVERLETEFTQSRERNKSGTVKANISIGKLLGAMLGLAEIGAETELLASGKRIDEAKMRFTPEQRLSALLKYMNNLGGTKFFEQLAPAASHSLDTGTGCYINIFERFDMPQFSHGNGVEDVNEDKTIAFVIGQFDTEHDFDDAYFKKKKKQYTFIMRASLGKTTGSRDGMRQTGHDAVFFQARQGKNVPINVFGYLMPLSKYSFQIKPFAMWI